MSLFNFFERMFPRRLVFEGGKEYNKRRSFGEGAESLLIERT